MPASAAVWRAAVARPATGRLRALPGGAGVVVQGQTAGLPLLLPLTVMAARQPTSSASLSTSPTPMLVLGSVPPAQLGSSAGELVTLVAGAAVLPHQQLPV